MHHTSSKWLHLVHLVLWPIVYKVVIQRLGGRVNSTTSVGKPLWFIALLLCVSISLWCGCPSQCFMAAGYSIVFGQQFWKEQGFCISVTKSPIGLGWSHISVRLQHSHCEGQGAREWGWGACVPIGVRGNSVFVWHKRGTR